MSYHEANEPISFLIGFGGYENHSIDQEDSSSLSSDVYGFSGVLSLKISNYQLFRLYFSGKPSLIREKVKNAVADSVREIGNYCFQSVFSHKKVFPSSIQQYYGEFSDMMTNHLVANSTFKNYGLSFVSFGLDSLICSPKSHQSSCQILKSASFTKPKNRVKRGITHSAILLSMCLILSGLFYVFNYTYVYIKYTRIHHGINTTVQLDVPSSDQNKEALTTDNDSAITFSPENIMEEGVCTPNISWFIDALGVLYIEGAGDMPDYEKEAEVPWSDYRSNIKSILMDDRISSIGSYSFCKLNYLEKIQLSSSLTHIGDHAFESCKSLITIAFPDLLTSIGNYSFHLCQALTSLNFNKCESLLSLGDYCFKGCISLSTIFLPETIYQMGVGCFRNCSSLYSVDLPKALVKIPDECFYDDQLLSIVEAPFSMKEIGNKAFYGCFSITNFYFPNELEIIGSLAFARCTNLDVVNLGFYVREIQEDCFHECKKLVSITLHNPTTTIHDSENTIPMSIAICAKNDSTAYQYATNHGNQFIPIP